MIVAPEDILKKYPSAKLYILRHYEHNDNKVPLYIVDSNKLVDDLKDIDNLYFYEYSYIFDLDFKYCYFITDSCREEMGKCIPHLILFDPVVKRENNGYF